MTQLTAKGERTRARLLGAAEQELLSTGRIEVVGVAERAEASIGLLYRYFTDKNGLVEAVVDAFYDRYEEAVFSVPAPDDVPWLDHEQDRIQREVAFLFADPLTPRIVGGTPEEPAAALADARRLAHHIDLARRNIERGVARGEINLTVPPELAAAAIIGSLRACIGTAFIHDTGEAEVVGAVLRAAEGLIEPT